MALGIATNLASINAQRNLSGTSDALNTSLQRLSSGLRINSAKDDAAGLQISNRLTSQVNGLNQAVRNANDGISLAQTAEGALQESTNILQRMRVLSIQAANASNGASERSALNQEVTQLKAELDRIANNTSFGSQKLLNGTFSSKAFQVGSNANETVRFSITSAQTDDLGSINTVSFANFDVANESSAVTAANLASTNNIASQTLTFTVDGSATALNVSAGASAADVADQINANVSGVAADAKSGARIAVTADDGADGVTLEVNGVSIGAQTGGSAAALGGAIATAIQNNSALGGLTVTDNGDGTVDVVDETGNDVTVTFAAVATGGGGSDSTVTVDTLLYDGSAEGTAVSLTQGGTDSIKVTGDIQFTTSLSSSSSISVATTNTSGGIMTSATGAGTVATSSQRIQDVDISTASGAQTALGLIDSAIAQIDSSRATLGAVQSRFSSTISNLQNVSENAAAARSRIRDADFAAETAALTKAQVLQQAGLSMLSQANALPQQVLSLLQ